MKKKMLSISLVIICVILVYWLYTNLKSSENQISIYNASPIGINSNDYLVDETPLFTHKDIKYFDWDNQIIIFKKTSGLDLTALTGLENNYQTLSRFATGQRDKFYLYLDDELVYSGYYGQSMISSFFADGITMTDIENGVKLSFNSPDNLQDKRYDSKLYEALKSQGLLKE